jgi:hypothetical protein
MKPIAIIVAKYSVVLFIWLLLLWWALFYSPIDVPEYIPHTPIKVFGLAFFAFTLTILILSQKEALRKVPALSMVKLVFIGTAICFFREVLFQIVLSFTFKSDKFYHFVTALVASTILCAVLSFFVAFQLKTKKTGLLVLFIILALVLFRVLMAIFPSLNQHSS